MKRSDSHSRDMSSGEKGTGSCIWHGSVVVIQQPKLSQNEHLNIVRFTEELKVEGPKL